MSLGSVMAKPGYPPAATNPGVAKVENPLWLITKSTCKLMPARCNVAGERLQALFRSVERRPPWPSEIKTVIDVVSDAKVTLVGTEGRGNPDEPVALQGTGLARVPRWSDTTTRTTEE